MSDIRDEFEALKRAEGNSIERDFDRLNGEYVSPLIQRDWRYYQAGRAAAEADRLDAQRYRLLRRKVCIIGKPRGAEFEFTNIPLPTHIAPRPEIELDAAIDAALSRRRTDVTKTYPLDIENVGGDTYILMSRGHHDVHEFMKKVREDGYDWPLGMPKHVWMRALPTRNPGYNCMYHDAKEGERGAFPATYAWEAYGEDRYEAMMTKESA